MEKRNAKRYEQALSLMEEKLECVFFENWQTGEEYVVNYTLGDRLLAPETHEFETLEDYLDYLAVSVQAVEVRMNYLLNCALGEATDDEFNTLRNAKVKVLESYFKYHSGDMSFESKRDYYARRLNYALAIAHSEANELVDHEMHYYDDQDRQNPEYSSLNSKCVFLRNAKKKFEESGEMDDYVLEIANRLESRYDHLY